MWKLTLKSSGLWDGEFEFETIFEATQFMDMALSHAVGKMCASVEYEERGVKHEIPAVEG